MAQDKKALFSEWADLGENDELNILSILKHRDGTPSMVCFLSQQMAEKYMKGLLLFLSGDYPKIHSLIKLAHLVKPFADEITGDLASEIKLLDSYYVETRYVSDISLESYTWPMAEDAYAAAEKIKRFALKRAL